MRAPPLPTYRLHRSAPAPFQAPELDEDQRRVVAHDRGPLLVLAGPGTGKTTAIVEAVAARVTSGVDPEEILVLTFGRKAAAQLRERIAARVARPTKEPLARTFHSYGFGVLRREAALRGEPPPRLLSGPEQDLVIRDLLRGDLESGAGAWPARLHPALGTRGFAQELRDLIMRAYERGLGPSELDRLGRVHKRDDWRAAARFLRQYAGVTALRDTTSYDPAELIRAVVGLWIRDPSLLARERAARRWVFVDELQDTDPAQLDLLRLLAGDGRNLVAVGDPDQSIYGFRGADPAGISSFRERFPAVGGSPAPVVALRTSRRSGAILLDCSRRVAGILGSSPDQRRHHGLRPAQGVPDGAVTVAVLRSQSQEAAYIASALRAAHLVHRVPWSQMAVIVRSTVRTLPVLRRALAAAGVPTAVAGEEVPLVRQPGVRPLVLLVECALRRAHLDEDRATELLTSPLGGADVIGLRRLRRELRRGEIVAGGRRASGPLLVEALLSPEAMSALDTEACRPARRVAELLAEVDAVLAREGTTAEDVFWAAWSRSGLAARWARQSLVGGAAGAAADRDLDAVVALFEMLARFCDRLPAAGPQVFLDYLLGQEIPGDSLSPRSPDGDAVQLLTAHGSKGLEWDVVCVAGVQEGSWPDLRMRGSFLGSERLVDLLSPHTVPVAPDVATVTTLNRLLQEERRLFYVAVTRARRSLVVSSVMSEREGLQPSRFLDELDPLPRDVAVRPLTGVSRPLSMAGLVAELRRALTTPDTDAALLQAAAEQLARLARAGVRGADPHSWWGLLEQSGDGQPVHPADEAVPVSPSRLESFTRCELRWFLEHVGGTESSSASQSVGSLIHAVAASAVDPAGCSEEALLTRVEALLPGADLGRGWTAGKEAEKARGMVRRLARWLSENKREVVATELAFRVEIGRAAIAGQVDRIERDDAGRAVVVDLKTGSSAVAESDLLEHAQLAAYQLAAERGAFAAAGLTETGGAELVQLGKGAFVSGPRVQPQPPLSSYDDPGWAERLVLDAAESMAGSAFRAVDNKLCSRCPVRTSCPLRDEGRQVTG